MNVSFARMRKARILIPDNTPLSLLAMIGQTALDWLFAPGAEVWVTDMVREEAVREPDEGGDRREAHRAELERWFARNRRRIHIQATDEGEEYRKAMETWRRVPGTPAELKPSWKGRGERSILQVLDGIEKQAAESEAVIVIVDDRKARAAIAALENIDVDMMATETFIAWMAARFQIKHAETAWTAIEMAADGKAPPAPAEDPVHLQKSN